MSVDPRPYFMTPALYDRVYAPFTDDVPFWIECARSARGPTLEVACGDGRVLVPMRAAGVDADGLDADAAMLAEARSRLDARGLKTRLVQADMRDFTLPRRYGLVFIPFNSFLHNLTAADQIATLRCCREHLESGGTLMISLYSPDPRRIVETDGVWHVSFEHPDPDGHGTVRVEEATTYDAVEQHGRSQRRVTCLAEDGTERERHELTFELRWVWKNEMELLLRTAGFKRWAVEPHTSYTRGFARKPEHVPGDVMVWTAWKD